MKAIGAFASALTASEDGLRDIEVPRPEPSERDLLVEVRAVSVNPVDVKVRSRLTAHSGSPRILGWDAAGVVVDVGPAASLFKPGDEVYFAGDIQRPGCNSEYCLVDERIVGRKPKSLDFAEAAALPLTTITAYEALFERMRIDRGDGSRGKRLLIVGGAGGVGSIAIQLAKVLTATTVVATASRPESATWARRVGADHVINHRRELGPQLAELAAPQVDYVLCAADTDPYFEALVDVVAPQGVICFIVTPKAPVDMAPLQLKSATVTWELMYTRSTFQTSDMVDQHRLLDEVAALIDAGRVHSTLQRRLGPLSARTLTQAHGLIETGTTIGKIAVEGWA